MTDEILYKVLGENGECFNGGIGKWHLPKNGKPGKWMPPIKGELISCANGYHLCREQDLVHWLGPTIWEAEYKGKRVDDIDKVVVRQVRLIRKLDTWNKRIARLFACDCAEEALRLVEEPDLRSTEAIRIARHFAAGEATGGELVAAGVAARAAWTTIWNAVYCSAESAAWIATDDIAWAAARAVVGFTANTADQNWQTERLMEYLRGERG